MPPPNGASARTRKHLKNLYVYFWRWATLEGVRLGDHAATRRTGHGRTRASSASSPSPGFLNGPGFQKMRDDLRRDCADIWVIDCSPEGHQPDVPTRIFQGVQQPVCIVLAARAPGKDRQQPAASSIHGSAGRQAGAKFAALSQLDARRCRMGRSAVRVARAISCQSMPAIGRHSFRFPSCSSGRAPGSRRIAHG